MTTTQFDRWSKAVQAKDEVRTKLRSHFYLCPECNRRTWKFCPKAQLMIAELNRADDEVKRHSGPYGNPNVERYG